MSEVNISLETDLKLKKKHIISLTKTIAPSMFYSHIEIFQRVIDFYLFIIMNRILSFLCYICQKYIHVLYTVLYFCVLSKVWRCTNFLQVFIRSLLCTFVFSYEKLYGQLRPLNKIRFKLSFDSQVVWEYIAQKTAIDETHHAAITEGKLVVNMAISLS